MKKKKVLFLSDDIRGTSGVSNISKQIILQTCHEYDWVQLSASASSDSNKIIDVSESVNKIVNSNNSYVRLYCSTGYGDSILLRNIISQEKPDAILHMTDPHRWSWLYEMEHEIRKEIPILYYHVWDNTPYPTFLKYVYNSCDWIGCISKLTFECVNEVCPNHHNVEYIPHGVDTNIFTKETTFSKNNEQKQILGRTYSFVVFLNNANIPRKQIHESINSFSKFYERLTDKEKKNVLLLIHTDLKTKNGSNLENYVEDAHPSLPVKFSFHKLTEVHLNRLYNLSDLTINISYNEGFGLTTLESLSAETPILVNYTGGLIDQSEDNPNAYIVKPNNRVVTGGPKTPYIYLDYCCGNDVADKLLLAYNDRNKKRSSKSYRSFLKKHKLEATTMCSAIQKSIGTTIDNFIKRSRYTVDKIC